MPQDYNDELQISLCHPVAIERGGEESVVEWPLNKPPRSADSSVCHCPLSSYQLWAEHAVNES